MRIWSIVQHRIFGSFELATSAAKDCAREITHHPGDMFIYVRIVNGICPP